MAAYQMIHEIYVLLDDGDRRILRTYGLNTSQYAALLLLQHTDGLRLTELSSKLLREKSTMTRVIDRLVHAGYVERRSDPDDRRAQRVVLTVSGREQVRRATIAHQHSLDRRMRALSDLEHDQLHTLLHKLRTGLRAELDAPPEPLDYTPMGAPLPAV